MNTLWYITCHSASQTKVALNKQHWFVKKKNCHEITISHLELQLPGALIVHA